MESRSQLREQLEKAEAENEKLKSELSRLKGKVKKETQRVGPPTEKRPMSHTDMQVRG